MNYYIMPKNNMNINIFLEKKNDQISPYISYSLIYHLNDIYNNLLKLDNSETIEYINKIVNPYEFIYSDFTPHMPYISRCGETMCLLET